MSRGDQRERDRAKNQAKQAAKMKATSKGGDPLLRNASDASALQAKVEAKKKAKAEAEAAAAAAASGKAPVVRKKVPSKKNETIDDLLSVGLTGGKKKRAK